ncbi:MAG: OmpA family protein [Kofleriaceae bacterium]
MSNAPDDPSGILVYPKAQVPKRESEPRVRGFSHGGGGKKKLDKKLFAVGGGALVAGGILGFMFAPGSHKDEADRAKAEVATATHARTVEKDRADGLDQALTALKKEKADEDKQLAALTGKAADVDKKAEQLAAEEKKLQGTIDKSQGSVDTEGDEIHLRLVDKVLFPVGDDQLSDKGKTILDKVAVALKDLPDKQVWVQGHTDDQPIYIAPQKKDPKAKPLPKGAKPPPAPVKFITNWELSAARALQVVHYLQDTAKVDPSRLAALAFGQYRPVSRSNKAANRRIEIVLYPKRAVLEKAPKK